MSPKLTAVPDPEPRPSPPDLRDSVAAALGAMTWLATSDGGLKALALRAAEEIEAAAERAEEFAEVLREARGDDSLYKRVAKLEAQCEMTKTVGWLGPQLQGYLRDLGGTPGARAAMAPDKPIGGRLAQLRADAAGRQVARPEAKPPAKRAPRNQAARQHDAAHLDPPAR